MLLGCRHFGPNDWGLDQIATSKHVDFFEKNWPLFSLFSSCLNLQLTVNRCSTYKFPDPWIQTADLWCRKRPLCQLSNNHCPKSIAFTDVTIHTAVGFSYVQGTLVGA